MLSPRRPLRTEVADELVAMIIDRRLQPGDKLGTEVDLARELVVSRNVIREAVRTVSSQGIIEVKPGIGLFVCRPRLAPSAGQLKVSAGMDKAALLEMMEARRVIELGVVPLVVRNATPEQIDRIGQIIQKMQDIIDRGSTRIVEYDLSFHMAFLQASGNLVLAPFGGALVEFFTQKPPTEHTPAAVQAVQDFHRRIYEALLIRDEDALREAVDAHLSNAVERLQRHMEAAGNGKSAGWAAGKELVAK